jgi:F-type H+-transporting ATPase subunit b
VQIDWITVSAQIVNFLVLVWLLQHFLYRPVIQAMQRREQRIRDRLDEAGQRERAADDRARQYEDERAALAREREGLLAEAREQAESRRKEMLDEARAAVDEQRRQWQAQLEQERRELAAGLRRRSAESVQRIARRALRDLADAELESRIIDNFVARLKDADEALRQALADGSGALEVRTSFTLEPAARSRLTRALHEQIDAAVEVEYVRDDDLLCGIEARRGDRRLGWNLADYTRQVAEHLDEAVQAAATTVAED